MGLKEQLSDDLKSAMKAGDAVRRETLRSLLTAVNNAEVARVNVKDESATRQGLPDADTRCLPEAGQTATRERGRVPEGRPRGSG